MKKLVVIIICLGFAMNAFSKNLGHRASGGKNEFFKSLPENSLSSLRAALTQNLNSTGKPLQFNKDFKYLEFDIQETFDGKIVVFHDKGLERVIPTNGINKEIYKELLINKSILARMSFYDRLFKKLKIKYLTLDEIKRFHLRGIVGEKVPTLAEMLSSALKLKIRKPVAVEIKYLRTNKAKLKVIELVSDFKRELDSKSIIFETSYDMEDSSILFASKKRFKNSFGVKWCDAISNAGLKFFKTRNHYKLCK